MSGTTIDGTTSEMSNILWGKVSELQEARKKAFKEHEEYRKKMLPHMTPLAREVSKGCPEAARIAGQIEQIIETGKLLGLIEKNVSYLDHI